MYYISDPILQVWHYFCGFQIFFGEFISLSSQKHIPEFSHVVLPSSIFDFVNSSHSFTRWILNEVVCFMFSNIASPLESIVFKKERKKLNAGKIQEIYSIPGENDSTLVNVHFNLYYPLCVNFMGVLELGLDRDVMLLWCQVDFRSSYKAQL